jgi:SIR2-like domain
MVMLSNPGWKNPDAIGFLFGAGASIEFGIPSMKQLTKSFANKIQKKNPMVAQVYTGVYDSLAEIYGEDKVDLEAIMSVIVGLKEENRLRDNIGDLGLFVLANKRNVDFADIHYEKATLDRLEIEYKSHIRARVKIKGSRKIDFSRKVYTDFFKQICNVTTCNNATAPDSNLGKYIHDKWTFFTTNYDNAIEDFWVNGRQYHGLDLGFVQKGGKKIMDADNFLRTNTLDFNINGLMQLVKLHGSVNWTMNKNNQIEEHTYQSNYDYLKSIHGSGDILGDILIYPLSQKELYFTPFLQLFSILNADLRRRFFWITIGYSFRDIIIRTMFEKALLEDRRRKILLVHPHATQDIKPIFPEAVHPQIICLDSYFAKKNYVEVNSEISQVLVSLEPANAQL